MLHHVQIKREIATYNQAVNCGDCYSQDTEGTNLKILSRICGKVFPETLPEIKI